MSVSPQLVNISTPQRADRSRVRRVLFAAFLLSGFCSLLYQIVWLRLAFAAFGVITPVLSTVLSVFMLGLALGSWLSGKWITTLSVRWNKSAIWFYAMCELLIGIGGILVPWIFALGQQWLLHSGDMDSGRYLILSALVLCISILPWCVFMGCTFPFVIAFIRQIDPPNRTGFSFLYLANVIGAMLGAVLSAGVLIELLGLRGTLWTAAACNFAITAIALSLSQSFLIPGNTGCQPVGDGRRAVANLTSDTHHSAAPAAQDSAFGVRRSVFGVQISLLILFLTGFTSMAMEVVWTRAFTPVLKTTIYSFAGLLTVYLLATWIGSLLYRRQLIRARAFSTAALLGFLAISIFVPILAEDPRISMPGFVLKMLPFAAQPGSYAPAVFKIVLVLLSIFPFCAGLGYLTPKLIDEYSTGSPSRTGNAYALNVLGCILGPLFAGYLLLPYLGVAQSLRLLAIPFVLGLLYMWYATWHISWHRPLADGTGRTARPAPAPAIIPASWHRLPADETAQSAAPHPAYSLVTTIAVLTLLFVSTRYATSYEDRTNYRHGVLRRDYTATVLATGDGRAKSLLVNGIPMTGMNPITKVMAHLPLACLDRRPESALVICLGMGTTLRSVNSWGIDATAVELVPSVRKVSSYFFSDAEEMLRQPNCRVVIDDGRRFLARTSKKYDLITIDPPPPVEAAGSSLLYSREFYQLLKAHLTDDGIVQVWFPGGEMAIRQAVARSVLDEFPNVRTYRSMIGHGYHFLASMRPFSAPTIQQFHNRLPPKAQADLLEWSDNQPFDTYAESILDKEISTADLLNVSTPLHLNSSTSQLKTRAPSFQLRASAADDRKAFTSRPSAAITDNHPYNEYFLLRRLRSVLNGTPFVR